MLEFQNHSWYQLLEPDQALAAIAIARAVAARLRERDRVEAAVSAAAQQTAFPQSVHWQPSDVAQGYAGLAIMCSYLDACLPDEGWDVTGHHCIELAAQAMEGQTHRPMGLFSGLSGLAFASWCLSRGGTRYRRLLAGIDEVLVPQVIAQVHHLSGQRHGVSVGQFDLISGLTGVGTYLLCRREEPGLTAALTAILSCLVELTRQELGLPCWHTPAHLVQDRTMQRYYPYGNLNCGLAHGIPGPLGLLALAQRENMMVEGMTDAINRVADWLARNRLDDTWGINWPTTVPLTLAGTVLVPTNAAAPLGSSRTAWCYGSPGVARALWLAPGRAPHRFAHVLSWRGRSPAGYPPLCSGYRPRTLHRSGEEPQRANTLAIRS